MNERTGEILPWPLMTPEQDTSNALALIRGEANERTRLDGRKPTTIQAARARLRNACRQKTVAALNVLHEVMSDPKAPPSSRLRAACEILDRGWGKPASEPMEVEPIEQGLVVDVQATYRSKTYQEWQAMKDREERLAAMVDDPDMREAIRKAAERGHSPASVAGVRAVDSSCDDWSL